MEESIDSLAEAQVFTMLDANKGYWRIEIENIYRHETTLTTPFGTYWYTCIPIRFKNEASTYQRAIHMILATARRQFALMYLDDIIIFSTSF